MSANVALENWLERWDQFENQHRLSHIHEGLTGIYSEPHRHYHNLDHIAACLDEFTEVEHLIQHPFNVWLSIWFHDVVYDPKAHDNEERSVDYAKNALREITSEGLIEIVSLLILATRHDRHAIDHDAKLIQDIDLAILGGKRDRFDEYEEGIRSEYAWVPENRFRKGRADILNGFLERESIYQTDYFREKYEEIARANLRLSITRLKNGV